MGIIDTILGFFNPSDNKKDAEQAMKEVTKAISQNSYNQASIKAFYALEKAGEIYLEVPREVYMTAREYAKHLSESSTVTMEEMEPILSNYEIAKYSEHSVDLDSIQTVESTLQSVTSSMKSGVVKKSAPRSRGRTRGRGRKPRKGGTTGAARRRRRSRKE